MTGEFAPTFAKLKDRSLRLRQPFGQIGTIFIDTGCALIRPYCFATTPQLTEYHIPVAILFSIRHMHTLFRPSAVLFRHHSLVLSRVCF